MTTPINQMTVVSLTDNSTTVSSTAAVLVGIYVNTSLSAHACPIEDNGTALLTLPASLTAGNYIEVPEGYYATNLVVNPNDAATGSITVMWRGV